MTPVWMRREAIFHVFQTRHTWQVRGAQFGASRQFRSFDLAMGAARTAAAACGLADSAKTLLRVWPRAAQSYDEVVCDPYLQRFC